MSTTSDTFHPSSTDQDFTASGEVDIRKLVDSGVGGSDNTTIAGHTNSAAEIILDPYTNRSTTGTTDAPNAGWAINRTGSDGMGSTSTGKRYIASGTWTFNARIGVAAVSIANIRMRVRLYRVSSSGSRSLIAGPYNSSTVTPTVAGNNVSATGNPGEIEFEEDETILVSYGLDKTNSGLGTGQDIQFRLNDTVGNDVEIILPQAVRTNYFRSVSVVGKGVASYTKKIGKIVPTVVMTGVASFSRQLTLFRSFTNTMTGVMTVTKKINLDPSRVGAATMLGAVTIIKQIQKPLSATMTGVPTIIKKVQKTLTATFTGVASYSRLVTAFRSFTNTMTGVASFQRKLTIRRAFTNTMLGAVVGFTKKVGKPLSATMTGIPSIQKKIIKTLSATFTGVATNTKKVKKPLSATMTGIASFQRALTIRRAFTKSMKGVVTIWTKFTTTVLDRIELGEGGGGTTKKIFHIFDD